MILFCEDCGDRNSIGPYQVTDQNAVFRCSSCNYLNTIVLGDSNKTEPQLEDLVETINSTPGIVGFFLFHIESGLFYNHMPKVLLPEDLEIIGKILISNYKICSFQFPDITRQVLVIEGKNLVMQMINDTCGLILACKAFPLTVPIDKMLNQIQHKHWSLKI